MAHSVGRIRAYTKSMIAPLALVLSLAAPIRAQSHPLLGPWPCRRSWQEGACLQAQAYTQLRQQAADAGAPDATVPPSAPIQEAKWQRFGAFEYTRLPFDGELNGTVWLRRGAQGNDSLNASDPESGGSLLIFVDGRVKVNKEGADRPVAYALTPRQEDQVIRFQTLSKITSFGSGAWSYQRRYDCRIWASNGDYLACEMLDQWTDNLDSSQAKIKDPQTAPAKGWFALYSRVDRPQTK